MLFHFVYKVFIFFNFAPCFVPLLKHDWFTKQKYTAAGKMRNKTLACGNAIIYSLSWCSCWTQKKIFWRMLVTNQFFNAIHAFVFNRKKATYSFGIWNIRVVNWWQNFYFCLFKQTKGQLVQYQKLKHWQETIFVYVKPLAMVLKSTYKPLTKRVCLNPLRQ